MPNIDIQSRLNLAPSFGTTNFLGIDQSAWVSSASFGLGAILSGPVELATGGSRSLLVVIAYVAFLAAVTMIQRHMRLATTATTFGTPKGLITDGIFEFSRNPIYVAFLLPLASLALFSLPAMVIATVVYLVGMNFLVIPKEENDLTRLFGNEFLNYAAKTRRWI